MRGQRAVGSDHRPAVLQRPGLLAAGHEHRLDGEAQAWLEPDAGVRVIGGEIEHRRILVHQLADAVAAVPADDAVAGLVADGLHRGADVTDAVPGLGCRDPGHQCQARRVDERDRLGGACVATAADERARPVAVPPLVDDPDVDRHHLPPLDLAVAGDAMDDLVVDRDAGGRLVGVRVRRVVPPAAQVAQERRDAARDADVPLGQTVDLSRRDAGPEGLLDQRQDLRHDAPRGPHPRDLVPRLGRDLHQPATCSVSDPAGWMSLSASARSIASATWSMSCSPSTVRSTPAVR